MTYNLGVQLAKATVLSGKKETSCVTNEAPYWGKPEPAPLW